MGSTFKSYYDYVHNKVFKPKDPEEEALKKMQRALDAAREALATETFRNMPVLNLLPGDSDLELMFDTAKAMEPQLREMPNRMHPTTDEGFIIYGDPDGINEIGFDNLVGHILIDIYSCTRSLCVGR